MITKEESLKRAQEVWDEIDYCTEYENGYVFSKFGDRSFGGPGPVVVLKDDGQVVNMVYFCNFYDSGKELSAGYIADWK